MEFKSESGRIWLDDESGNMIAEITYPQVSDDVVNISRTYVSRVLRGQGMASKLVQAAVDDIRAKGQKATAGCSYAVSWFEQHPECTDILKSE
ncbi:MAG: N-acetyltransferase [Oscillospiraceae bacterium]|nr:N-acetyltransferase [Oscillospiraceae bacterium]